MRSPVMLLALLVCGAAAQTQKRPPAPPVPDAARQSPGYPAYERANRLLTEQKVSESLGAVNEALSLDPRLVPALTLKAKLEMAANRYDLARQTLERAIAIDPASWYAQFLYGFQLYQQSEMPAAAAALAKARKLNPKDGRTVLYLGLTEESVGRTAESLALYREAIRLEEVAGKLDTEPLLVCARLQLLLGNLEESGRLIERALQLDPESRDPHFESARRLLAMGNPAAAAKEGETALRLHSGDATDRQVHFLLVRAYQASGQEQEAARHAAALRAMGPAETK